MSNCLIMLTNTYPFDGGEYFIENEIEIVSRSFDKVIICALDANVNDTLTRDVPSNTAAFITGMRSRKSERAEDLIRASMNMFFSKGKNIAHDDIADKDFRKKLFREYFLSRTRRQYRQVMNKLPVEELKKYDRVIIYSYWLFVTANVAVEIKKKLLSLGINAEKVISRAHGYDIYEERNPLKYLPEREYLLENLDKVFTCSKHGEKYLKEKYPSFAGKISCSFLGTKDYGISQKSEREIFTIVTCSSLNPVKRVWRVADTLSLYTGAKSIKWIHIGGSGKMLQKLKTYTEQKLSGKKVTFEFKGQMTNKQVNEFYLSNSPDMFLNVSESEGVPVSIMEAASFGIPVMATDCGGTKEAVENGVTGKLINKDFSDSELIKEIMEFMSLKRSEIDKMSESSRNMWMKKYNAEKNYSDFAAKIIS